VIEDAAEGKVRVGVGEGLDVGARDTTAIDAETNGAFGFIANGVAAAFVSVIGGPPAVSNGFAIDGVSIDGVAIDGVAIDGVAIDGVAVVLKREERELWPFFGTAGDGDIGVDISVKVGDKIELLSCISAATRSANDLSTLSDLAFFLFFGFGGGGG
jgi:hypothetical protein